MLESSCINELVGVFDICGSEVFFSSTGEKVRSHTTGCQLAFEVLNEVVDVFSFTVKLVW
jgi:hypothetical protein